MASSSVPLHCNVCPKNPTFSDVSHLLTHVASKGHLSHYYKLKISSGQNHESKQQLDQYDLWYSTWNIESLMSDRMQQKEKNRPRARAKAPKPRSKKSSSKNTSLALDPRLKGYSPYDSDQPTSLGRTQARTPPTLPYYEKPSTPPRHGPKLHLWSTQEPASHRAVAIDFSSPKYGRFDPHPDPFVAGLQPSLSLHGPNIDGLGEIDELVGEAAKIKGVCWPGMDIFDSATPEMRRRRNQKKDVSVVEQLEQNSQEVEPTEMIFFPFGDLKKQRKISGRVEFSSSPEILEKPPLPKRRSSKRYTLAENDVNSKSKKPLGRPAAEKKLQDSLRPPAKSRTRKSEKKSKRAFTVFNDQPNGQFGSQTGMNVLTSGFQPPQNHASQREQQHYHHPSDQQDEGHYPHQQQSSHPMFDWVPHHHDDYFFGLPPAEAHSHQSSHVPINYDLAAILTAHLQTYHPTEPESTGVQSDGRNDSQTITDGSLN
ncbi:MAG: hypothetical protein M1831_002476 [Alyxoria varia]|nr:MAG: hypothetical protein M1831_002476 [Alyxoria varia]